MKELQPPPGENVRNVEWKKGLLLRTFKLCKGLDVQRVRWNGCHPVLTYQPDNCVYSCEVCQLAVLPNCEVCLTIEVKLQEFEHICNKDHGFAL